MPALNVHGGPEIAAGESLSDVVEVGDDIIVGIVVPENWTSAAVSVMVSPDGISFLDLFDGKGNEFTFNVEPGTAISINSDLLLLARFIKLRSGTRKSPVVQKQNCKFRTIGTAASPQTEASRR